MAKKCLLCLLEPKYNDIGKHWKRKSCLSSKKQQKNLWKENDFCAYSNQNINDRQRINIWNKSITRLKYASRKSWSFWFPSVPYRAASTFHRVMENMRWDYASWTLQKCIKKICDLVLKKVFHCIPVSTVPIFPR